MYVQRALSITLGFDVLDVSATKIKSIKVSGLMHRRSVDGPTVFWSLRVPVRSPDDTLILFLGNISVYIETHEHYTKES